jgi:glycosyltransferase involved in cell wall biosynthesis
MVSAPDPRHRENGVSPGISVVVCAFNEEHYLAGCLHSILAQTRPPDELVVVDNNSSDGTAAVARAIGVPVVNEARRGLVHARDAGRRATRGELLVYVDADTRLPIQWLERVERRFHRRRSLVGLSGACRFYDWDALGRAMVRAYDMTAAPLTHTIVHHVLHMGAVFYGGAFCVRREALTAIGGFDTSIEFHGEDTNLGRRLSRVGAVALSSRCHVYTSARRYRELGRWTVFGTYVRNFWWELLAHRPYDTRHLDIRT